MDAKRVAHVITGLDTGGAEMMLYKLLSRYDRAAFASEVISLTGVGVVGQRIKAMGIPVSALGMSRKVPSPSGVMRLVRRWRRDPPDLVQTWMYHGDVVGGLAAKMSGHMPILWGIRQSNLDPAGTRRRTIFTARIGAWLSPWVPTRIVCGSQAARRTHEAMGYSSDKMIVIPNGFDLDEFRPSQQARKFVRRALGIGEDAVLIGMVGRFDPQKDHHNFVSAAGLLHADIPDVRFLLCGDGVTWENHELVQWIEAAGVRSRFHLLGRRDDMATLNAALDVAALSSWGEGFPNVIGEAMACAVPCVVTDAGDSALIVGETGRVVPPRDAAAMAAAWRELLEMPVETRRALGLAARARIEAEYGLQAVAARYEQLYREVLDRCAA